MPYGEPLLLLSEARGGRPMRRWSGEAAGDAVASVLGV